MQIFFSVGEPSGDLHGANLIRELRVRRDNIECVGFGGPKMAAAGCQLHADLTELAIMWFLRAILNLPRFWNLLREADKHFRHHRPDAVVLIDYPGFNWWVARRAKAHGIPVVYYGTPQIWAWATHRVHKLRRLVDHALCKLPFEPDWYRQRGCQATYIGHPYFDDLQRQTLDAEFLEQQQDAAPLVVLLPGSRRQEVTANLPAFLQAADFVHGSVPAARFAIASFNAEQAEMARALVAAHKGPARFDVYQDRTRELIRLADCCLACSGSVSLELLHECKPTVVHYRVGRFGYWLQSKFRRCRFITLVNLLTSERRFEPAADYDPDDCRLLREAPFPEYLSSTDCAAEMAHHLVRWLVCPSQKAELIESLRPLQETFVAPGASSHAADYILQHIPEPQVRELRPHYLPGAA